MRNLEEFELAAVSGGDHWGYENADGGIDEDRSSSYASSYQTGSSGIWGSTGGSSSSNMGNVAAGLAGATVVLGVAAQVTRFIPGAQVLSAGLTVMGLGTAALAGAAGQYATAQR